MDSYAYLELALVWEAPTEPKLLEGLNWQKLSSQAYIRLLSVALVLSVLSVAASASAALERRDNGQAVRVLQQRLKDLGYFPVNQPTTIYYRQITEDAVRKYQIAYGLQPTGSADDVTLYSLGLAQSPPRSIPFYPPSPGIPRSIRSCDGLRFSHEGPSVRYLQQQLKALGFFAGKVDGKYRERTRDAVTRFQQSNNLTPTGCADSTTRIAITQGVTEISYAYPPIPCPQLTPITGQGLNTFRTLRRGNSGSEVRELQNLLTNLRFNPGVIDGEFGYNTENALKDFQRAARLDPSGVATPSVQFVLRNASLASVSTALSNPYYPSSTIGYR